MVVVAAALLILGLALVSIVGGAGVLGGAGASTAAPTATPQPTFDFTVQDLNGEQVRLSEYRGQVVLVNFWATWCAPCKEEMPILDAYYREHRDHGFVLLAVNVSDRPEEAAAFAEAAGYAFPILYDPPGNVLIDIDARGLPTSLLIDAEGRRLQTWVGPLTRDILEEEVTPLLAVDGLP